MSFMAEPKPIASLSSGLLARKGAARPAMRRQGLEGLGQMGGMLSQSRPDDDYTGQDDLGWNDMGYDVDPAHDEHAPDYGNLLAGAIPDAPAANAADHAAAVAAADAMAQPLVPIVPDVVRQQAEIAERMAEPVAEMPVEPEAQAEAQAEAVVEQPEAPAQVLSVRKRKVAVPVDAVIAAVPAGRRAAFTLRLDTDRHLKLRLASAVTGQSAQQLLTAALDELLTKIPEIEDLAGRVPRSAGR
jgi:cellulase/cellobiase CelA1